jgi:uncharacterized protein
VEACADMAEVDIIHPIVNKNGIGIGDGTIGQMLNSIRKAFDKGKGIYSMKPLGGGNLLNSYGKAIEFVLNIPYIHSVAIGMQSVEEVIMNINVFEKKEVPEKIRQVLESRTRNLHIDYWCDACGKCIERCGQGALKINDGKTTVIKEKCVLCGYCGSACPQFAIKIC